MSSAGCYLLKLLCRPGGASAQLGALSAGGGIQAGSSVVSCVRCLSRRCLYQVGEIEALLVYFEQALVHLAQQVTRFPTVLEQQLQLQQVQSVGSNQLLKSVRCWQVALSGQLYEYQAALQAVQEDAQLHNNRCEQLRNQVCRHRSLRAHASRRVQVDKMENKLDDQKAAARRERVQARAQADAKEVCSVACVAVGVEFAAQARSTMLQHEIDDMRRQCAVHKVECMGLSAASGG